MGRVRFRRSRAVPEAVKSFRITRDGAGRWHVAFAAVPAPGTGEIVGVDWVEKTSTDLARRFDVIGVEALKIAAMTRSARGTVAEPGRRVARKRGLNRGILASGWGQPEHKALGRVVKVNPRYTSQTRNTCGHTARESRESQALFRCVACGHQDNADVNAARDIADSPAGRAVAARGGSISPGPTNREPQLLLLPG
ncbi:hypothetical protein GCM10027176_87970 [Actinoallomurus bryophytorum]